MKKEYHFIYKTTCNVNNKFYVGMHSTDNLEDGYIGSGKRLWYSINKYGKENFTFEILESHPNREELVKREKELVNEEFIKNELCLNLKPGGTGGFCSEDSSKGGKKSKIIQDILRKNNPEWVKRWKSKISNSQKKLYNNDLRPKKYFFNWSGKTHTDETKKKLSELKKGTGVGSDNSQFGSRWITNEIENKKLKKNESLPYGWRFGKKKHSEIEKMDTSSGS